MTGDLAYLTDDSGLQIIEVSDPAHPVRRGGYTTDGAEDVDVMGSRAYLASSYRGLKVLDVSDPAHPVYHGGYDTPAIDVTVAGNLIYVAADLGGLLIFDVSDPTH